MKKFIITASMVLVGWAINAQATFKVGTGAHLVLGDAILVVDNSHLILEGELDAGTSTVKMGGDNNVNLFSGGHPFHIFGLEKTAGTTLILLDSLAILDSFFFAGANNKTVLGSHNVLFGAAAKVGGYGAANYFITGSTGQVRKADLGASPFTFPVGFDDFTFNPVTVTENGTPDTLGIRCLEHALSEGCVGSPFSGGVVDASWELTEAIPGGMDVDMSVQWAIGDELAGFNRSFSGSGHYGVSGWDLTVDDCAPAAGADPFNRERSGIGMAGAFAVGNDSVATLAFVEIDLYLSGPYATGSGLMDDGLRAGGHLPAAEPFDALGFTHYGFGGGEMADPAVFDATGNDAIVDWVLVEIRSGADSTVIKATIPALLQRDGDITDLDGISPLTLPGIGEANYWVVVKHRNHLGVMSAIKLGLSGTPVSFDFTIDPANAFGSTNAVADFGDGFWGLFSGDFNHNGQVQNTDVTGMLPTLGSSGYLQGDFDMNSQVQNTDLQLRLLPSVGKGVQFPNN